MARVLAYVNMTIQPFVDPHGSHHTSMPSRCASTSSASIPRSPFIAGRRRPSSCCARSSGTSSNPQPKRRAAEMPWTTPTLSTVRGLVRDSIRRRCPGSDATVPNSVLRVLSDSQGALYHPRLQYLDWLSLQLLPDTAETKWLDRHGQIWLVNADGAVGRKMSSRWPVARRLSRASGAPSFRSSRSRRWAPFCMRLRRRS